MSTNQKENQAVLIVFIFHIWGHMVYTKYYKVYIIDSSIYMFR
ncbi:hypothetical protein MBFIL_12230 [Methanobrevibacter filiformis]|uniref:Uncharacterized protein n=1 Tax=Methanobrevibacter filiformis TaxID=55758 RepID=A0A166AK18_9EURY|nr:hypothetical protein MBFIL_12230 [Methanobrevibacter filiformis]